MNTLDAGNDVSRTEPKVERRLEFYPHPSLWETTEERAERKKFAQLADISDNLPTDLERERQTELSNRADTKNVLDTLEDFPSLLMEQVEIAEPPMENVPSDFEEDKSEGCVYSDYGETLEIYDTVPAGPMMQDALQELEFLCSSAQVRGTRVSANEHYAHITPFPPPPFDEAVDSDFGLTWSLTASSDQPSSLSMASKQV